MKKFILILLSYILTLSLTNIVFARNWVQVDEKVWVDADSATYDNNSVNVWVKLLNKGDMPQINNKKVWYLMANHTYYCGARETKTESITSYDLTNNVIATTNTYELNTKIIPETVSEVIYNTVCSVISYKNNNAHFKIKYKKK